MRLLIRSRLIPLAALVCAIAASAAPKVSSPEPQKTFATPQELVHALVVAAGNDDVPALQSLFGPQGKDIVNSGDPVQDKRRRADFARRAGERTQLEQDPIDPDRMFLSIGNDDWPVPVHLIRVNGRWQLDTPQARLEILARRIGANELATIETCRGYVEAQQEYASQDRTGAGMLHYAQHFISSPGQRDGLYWEATGDGESPIAKGFADAAAQGYRVAQGKRDPYHGYYFRILKAQGPDAPGGAFSYVVDGEMIGGFALVAWPAQYGVSGIQTFIVNQDGIVYQKDLGPNTGSVASAMTRYNPGKSWRQVE